MGLTPDYRITVDGKDITAELRSRLLSLRVRDAPGRRSDDVHLELRDGPTPIDRPPTGARLNVSLGWAGDGLTEMGTYSIARPEASSPPPTLRVQATAVHLSNGTTKPSGVSKAVSTEARTQVWTDTTLGDITRTIANRLDLEPAVSPEVGDIEVAHEEQDGESDVHFLSRLARRRGVLVKIAGDRLLVTKTHSTTTVSGKSLPTIELAQSEALSWSAEVGARDEVGTVAARWTDGLETAGDGEPRIELPRRFSSKSAAQSAARGELTRRRGKGRHFEADLRGRADIVGGTTLSLRGDWRPGVAGEWVVETVEHRVDDQGWVTSVRAVYSP